MGNRRKHIPNVSEPSTQKTTGQIKPPPGIDHQKFKWTAREMDYVYAGAWNWDVPPKQLKELLFLLQDCETKTWGELKQLKAPNNRKRHHKMPVADLCPEAQDRLADLQFDDDEVFRLRHGNMVRIWGVVQGGTFQLLWYDANHQVCPTS